MFKSSSYLKLAIVCLVALSFAPARDAVSATPELDSPAVSVEAPVPAPVMEPLTNLKYPGDCDSKTMRKAAEKGGCKVESGGEHFKVTKNGTTVTVIPHTVKENGTCRSIIKEINDKC